LKLITAEFQKLAEEREKAYGKLVSSPPSAVQDDDDDDDDSDNNGDDACEYICS
jgi:hypothetical protein